MNGLLRNGKWEVQPQGIQKEKSSPYKLQHWRVRSLNKMFTLKNLKQEVKYDDLELILFIKSLFFFLKYSSTNPILLNFATITLPICNRKLNCNKSTKCRNASLIQNRKGHLVEHRKYYFLRNCITRVVQ